MCENAKGEFGVGSSEEEGKKKAEGGAATIAVRELARVRERRVADGADHLLDPFDLPDPDEGK